MFIFSLIMLLLFPITMVGFGAQWKNNPPKTINKAFGYRTSRSMKSQEAWDFAHKYIAKTWLYTGMPSGIIPIGILIGFRNSNEDVLGGILSVSIVIQLIGLMFAIIPTEIALKRRFK